MPGVISITFDDGWQNQYDNAIPLMLAHGFVGTFYVITGYLSDAPSNYLSFAELQEMQSMGNEIGSHSVDHPDFTTLTDAQITQECVDSLQALQAYGLVVNNFAYPYGSYNADTDTIVSQYYRTGRDVFAEGGPVTPLPYSQGFDLGASQGDPGDPGVLAALQAIVDQVSATNEWAVIYFHQVLPNVVNSPEVTNTDTFSSFLDYVKAKGVAVLTVNEALNLTGPPGPPPTVSISPTSVNMDINQSQTFSSSIENGNLPFLYQWFVNGSAVSGATSDTYVFTPSEPGSYTVTVEVTDAFNLQTQSSANVTVTSNTPTKTNLLPVIIVGGSIAAGVAAVLLSK